MKHIDIDTRPIRVFERPFAVDQNTGLMQPGGFFDVSRGEQLIGIYFTPTIHMTEDIFGYYYVVKAQDNSGIQMTWSPSGHDFLTHLYPVGKPPEKLLFPGRPVLRYLGTDFSNAKPGKYTLRFIAHEVPPAGVGPQRRPQWDFEKTIFVIKTLQTFVSKSKRDQDEQMEAAQTRAEIMATLMLLTLSDNLSQQLT